MEKKFLIKTILKCHAAITQNAVSYYKNTKHALSIKIKIMRCGFIPNLKLIKTYYMQVLDGAEYI